MKRDASAELVDPKVTSMTIERLFFYPPLAFGRLGTSDTPLECFYWGHDDNTPHGTGKTTIEPGQTLRVADDGTVSDYMPEVIRFKDRREDGEHFRPVCPFFELHAVWTDAKGVSQEGPVTDALLAAHNLAPKDLTWEVNVANLKAFEMCLDPGTRVEASVTLEGDDVRPAELRGTAPAGAPNPLIPAGKFVSLGFVRLTRPNQKFPGLRLRFTPAKGLIYGPTDLKTRWQGVDIADQYLFLNKDSPWCKWKPAPDDPRGSPGGQYAQDDNAVSYGALDDVCDGIISCRLANGAWSNGRELEACARIVVGPPDYAPDRRHVVSLADGLKDRVDRAEVFADDYYAGNELLCDHELRELMLRIYETASLINIDAFNNRVNVQLNPQIAVNLGIPFRPNEFIAFPHVDPVERRPLPLSDMARQNHRRLHLLAVLKRNVSLPKYVREPFDINPFFDRRMPAVMRGGHGGPLTLTWRQYQFLMRWASTVVEPDTDR